MARATPSPLLSDISGKVGTSVFARYRGVLMVRAAPVTMGNPNSTAQANVRAAMVAFGTAWKLLTIAQKDAWEHFAQSQTSAYTSERWLQRHNLVKVVRGPQTGYDAFLQINMNRYLSGVSLITDILTTAPIGLPRPVGVADLVAVHSAGALSITWTTTATAEPTDRIQIWIRSVTANIHKQLIATADADSLGPVTISQVRSINGALIDLPSGTYEIQTIIVNEDGLKCAPSEIVETTVIEEIDPMICVLANFIRTAIQGTWTVGIQASQALNFVVQNTSLAINDEVHMLIYLHAGTYRLDTLYMTGALEPIIAISVDAQVVDTIDTYSAGTVFNVMKTTTGIVIATTGPKTLKIKVTGKNPASGNFWTLLSALQFTRTA